MQAVIQLLAESPVHLGFNYFDKLSAAIYSAVNQADTAFASALHDGLDHRNKIKLFGFSPLHSTKTQLVRNSVKNKFDGELIFKGQTSFHICSPWPELLNRIAEGLLTAGEVRIGSQLFRILQANLLPPPRFDDTMTWHPLKTSSILTSWTPRDTGKKRCVLPDAPFDGQTCETLLQYNLLHKWQRLKEIRPDLIEAWNPPATPITIDSIHVQRLPFTTTHPFKTKFHIVKSHPVKSWIAPIKLTAPHPIQRIAWSCGLGEMNSMGFGVVEASL